jgi:hypothetical protein
MSSYPFSNECQNSRHCQIFFDFDILSTEDVIRPYWEKSTAVDGTLSEVERGACRAFEAVATNFLGNFKTQNYESLARWRTSHSPQSHGMQSVIKINFLDPHLDFIPTNLGAVSDEHGERFHQGISTMKKQCWGTWSPRMLADCHWALVRGAPAVRYKHA